MKQTEFETMMRPTLTNFKLNIISHFYKLYVSDRETKIAKYLQGIIKSIIKMVQF